MFSAIAVPSIQLPLPQTPASLVEPTPVPGRLPAAMVVSPVAAQGAGDQTGRNAASRIAASAVSTPAAQISIAPPLRGLPSSASGPSSSFLAHLFSQGDESISAFDFQPAQTPVVLTDEVYEAISRLKYKPSDAALPRQIPPAQPFSYARVREAQAPQPAPEPVAAAAQPAAAQPAPEAAAAAPTPVVIATASPKAEAPRRQPDSLAQQPAGAGAYEAASRRSGASDPASSIVFTF